MSFKKIWTQEKGSYKKGLYAGKVNNFRKEAHRLEMVQNRNKA